MSSRKTLLVALVALGVAACSEERPPINRVQPNALEKKMFVGEKLTDPSDDPEFWFQGTVVDVGYGAAQDGLFTSTYAQPTSRVKFTIQENYLIARLTYERIANSDYKGVGAASNNGVIVAVYPIEKQFDIKKAYNSSTGEEYNVIDENTTDRPWYEREYMRVDWSRNLNVDSYDFDTLSQMGLYGGVKYESLAYAVNDPTDPDAPHFADGYFDVTTKAFARPQMIDLSHLGWGIDSFPACMLDPDFMGGGAPTATCNPVELTIRQSFRRVVDNDYEPENWDGYRFQAYGAFTADRKGYARNYGMTDDLWYRFIARYNIWDRSHVYASPAKMTGALECFTDKSTPHGADPRRDLGQPKLDADGNPTYDDNGKLVLENTPNGTADECEQATLKYGLHEGSRCDSFSQKCTVPFRDRTPTPLVWYVTTGSNFDLFDGTAWAAHDWDVTLRSAVMTARYVECRRTLDEINDCDTKYPVWHGQMDDNYDAIMLTREVDDCRHGKAWPDRNCDDVADQLGAERGYDAAVVALAKMPEMVVLCHSPVQADDPAICAKPDERLPANMTAQMCSQAYLRNDRATIAQCNTRPDGKPILNARLGDLRFHQVNIIPIPQTPSPWGIMVDSVDPLNGQKVSASINVWSHVGDLWSQSIIDVARYIKGEITTEDIIGDAKYIREWSQAAEAAGKGSALAMSSTDLDKRLSDFLGTDVTKLANSRTALLMQRPEIKEQLRKKFEEIKGLRFDARAPSTTRAVYEARRRKAVGSAMEAQLITQPMLQFAGKAAMLNPNAAAQSASILQGANPGVARDYQRMRDLALAERGGCMIEQAPAPTAIIDLADALERKFGKFNDSELDKGEQFKRSDTMRRYLAQRAQHSVIGHEMGHSMGMRHNFVSSSDAFNYRPQYWQLRTRNGQVTKLCTELQTTADGAQKCIGPRYFDPVTDEERKNMILMFMNSSIMEYPGEGTQDMLGVAAYDFATIRNFYGGAVAVYEDPSYKLNATTTNALGEKVIRSKGVLAKMDNFGGILGFSPSIGVPGSTEDKSLHYSQLQNEFALIKNCKTVEPAAFKPQNWDDATNGTWDPVFDGLIVPVGGQYTRCEQQKVDYVHWDQLKMPVTSGYYRGGPSIDPLNRVRVPYGFATDRWADLGNLSVYRHDNGADAYELFDFLISQQEINHVFDNYRRNRHTFSLRGAAGRQLQRYNTKMRDGAKGLGLMANIYRGLALEAGLTYNELWAAVATNNFKDNILASTIAFDHFTRQLSRPEAGGHYQPAGDTVLRSTNGAQVTVKASDISMNVYNGATGMFGNVAFGGRLVENTLAEGRGEYDSEFTMNCGSYYEKLYTSMLMTESVDNFISDSLNDFKDARYRAVSMADLFSDGYRRWLANNLTGDDEIKGPRVKATRLPNGMLKPATEGTDKWPTQGMGWTSWAGEQPVTCFQSSYNIGAPGAVNQACAAATGDTMAVDPEVGWEQWKFLVAWTMLYLPENQQRTWLDMMHVWQLGADSDPGFANRIEFHHPTGRTYIAKTYGMETIFGKTVQKGIAARVLEYANSLLVNAYEVDAGPDLNGDGTPDWWIPKMGSNGLPKVKFDPNMQSVGLDWSYVTKDGCNATDSSKCACEDNRACVELGRYAELPFFMRQAMSAYGLNDPSEKGVY